MAVGALTWTIVALTIVIPLASGGQGSPYQVRYAEVGGSPTGFVEKLFSDPGAIIGAVTSANDLLYVGLLVGPLLGAWALEPLLAAAALPEIALNLLSSHEPQASIQYQYVSGIVPFLLAASVLGLGRLRARHGKAMRLAAVSIVASMVWFSALLGPLSREVPDIARAVGSSHARAAERAVALVPAYDAVSATNGLGSHLSARRQISLFPFVKDARWVLVDQADPFHTARDDRAQSLRFARQLRRLDHDSRFERVFDREGISVYERVRPGTPGG
jgi:uncharacterized membrane protein